MRSTTTKRTARRGFAAVATAALLATPLAACSNNDQGGNGSSQSQSAPKPVAAIPALTGQSTAIKLDKGFTDALTQLKLTPGVVGDAQLQDGSLIFPITGGNVT